MNSMPAIATEGDTQVLEDLDWSPPCEYGIPGVDCPAAEWIVWCAPICEHSPVFRYFCDPCLDHRQRSPAVFCEKCGTASSTDRAGNVIRIERI